MTKRVVPYYRPHIDAQDVAAVVDSMKNGWLTTGPKAQQLERNFSQACGAKYAIALNSCTAGLHLGLAAMGIGPGDEVIVPSLTFVAGAQCVLHLGATPVFADIDPQSLCITADTIDPLVTSRTKAIMPMQYGGAPLDIQSIVDYARTRGIRVLEDAAHAVGTLDASGRWAGTVSDCAAFSFYATKNITSAEGGMFVTNDELLASAVRVLSLHGMDKDAWRRYTLGGSYSYDVVRIGYKYNMPDMSAALALAQLVKLDDLQAKRAQLADLYLETIGTIRGVRPVAVRPKLPARHSWCIFAILITDEIDISRDQFISELLERGVGSSVHFIPTHQMTAFRSFSHRPLPATEQAAERLISLPLYPGMSAEEVAYVSSSLRAIISKAASSHSARTS